MSIWWMNLAASSTGFIIGSVFLKRFADTGLVANLVMSSFTLLACSNLLFAQVLKEGLGKGIVASSMLQVITMATLGVVMFGERLSYYQVSGVFLATISLFLIMYPIPAKY